MCRQVDPQARRRLGDSFAKATRGGIGRGKLYKGKIPRDRGDRPTMRDDGERETSSQAAHPQARRRRLERPFREGDKSS